MNTVDPQGGRKKMKQRIVRTKAIGIGIGGAGGPSTRRQTYERGNWKWVNIEPVMNVRLVLTELLALFSIALSLRGSWSIKKIGPVTSSLRQGIRWTNKGKRSKRLTICCSSGRVLTSTICFVLGEMTLYHSSFL